MTIAGENTVKIGNILVGEVWIASGQSNMQWSVNQSDNPQQTVKDSANPNIRLITIKRQATPEPQTDIDARWTECGPQTVGDFSAVAYFFGRDLQQKLQVPVGLVSTNYGGTPAEAWTSHGALEAEPALKTIAANPATTSPGSPSGLYNAMIHPLLPFAIRGAIWYQGESNAGKAFEYRTLFPTMIKDWRARWGQGDFPFLLVQLAPYLKIDFQPQESAWAELRDAQLLATQTLPSVGMAVTTDFGDEADIHPKWKAPVGAADAGGPGTGVRGKNRVLRSRVLPAAERRRPHHSQLQAHRRRPRRQGRRSALRVHDRRAGPKVRQRPGRGAGRQSRGEQPGSQDAGRGAPWLVELPACEPVQRRGPAGLAVPHRRFPAVDEAAIAFGCVLTTGLCSARGGDDLRPWRAYLSPHEHWRPPGVDPPGTRMLVGRTRKWRDMRAFGCWSFDSRLGGSRA